MKSILEQQATTNRHMAEQQILNQQLFSKLEQMGAQQKEIEGKSGNSPIRLESMDREEDSGSGEEVILPRKRDGEQVARPPMSFHSKLEFPPFDGGNPRSWIKKCAKYFSLCKTPENQRVELASLYMVGRAERW